ncbi:putative clathrin assembly protein At5g35200 [Gastrolobium bilobum]|uniref:putative clathrin assembly protein At5g35200 n=1 Tax=Gastrolobium bilobum TaxID=150636 RepID=UPI002AB2CB3F|nr:putative clathrin assembly protein At5g35200 [Gastrolobium bilobum]
MKKAFGLGKVHGDHKVLDAAIVKATNYDHALPKEKHIRTIFQSLSPSKPRSEVVYCIHGLARRLSQTNNWAVALKTLIVIHRAMRELDYTVWEELVNYSKGRGYMIALSNFHDGSIPNASDYSVWIRNYALYLEERLQCFAIVNYDVGTYSSKYTKKLSTQELLEQLPALQNLLFRLLDCKPGGSAAYNRLIQYALSVVAGESVKIYVAITVTVVELLDKFFEMNRDDAISALQIYQKSGSQAERLSAFFETCRGLDFGRGQKFINIKKPPASFITTMEEYIKEAPCTLMIEYNVDAIDKGATANENAASEGDLLNVVNQDADNEDKSDPSQEKNEATAPPQAADLMGLYDLLTGASEFDENSLALAVVPTAENSSNSGNDENEASPVTGWEVALFAEPERSNENVLAESKEAGGLDALKLESLYDEANGGTQQNGAYHIGQVASNPFDFEARHDSQYNTATTPPTIQNAYFASPNMASPIPAQMVGVPYQEYYMMQQQQHQEPFTMNKKSTNPFDEPNMLPPSMPSHSTQST